MDSVSMTDNKETECVDANMSANVLTYRLANCADGDAVSQLVNSAYRGESSRQGWTNENEFMQGQRIDPDLFTLLVTTDGSVVLLFFHPDSNILVGCVSLQDASMTKNKNLSCCMSSQQNVETKKVHLGMLAVRPDLQARGYGKFILSTAENFVLHNWQIHLIEIGVLANRSELIAYYIRRGYNHTGQRQKLLSGDIRFGIPKTDNLENIILAKSI